MTGNVAPHREHRTVPAAGTAFSYSVRMHSGHRQAYPDETNSTSVAIGPLSPGLSVLRQSCPTLRKVVIGVNDWIRVAPGFYRVDRQLQVFTAIEQPVVGGWPHEHCSGGAVPCQKDRP